MQPEREVIDGVEFEVGYEPDSPGLIAYVSLLSIGAPDVPESMKRAVDFSLDDDPAELTIVRLVPAPEDDDEEAW